MNALRAIHPPATYPSLDVYGGVIFRSISKNFTSEHSPNLGGPAEVDRSLQFTHIPFSYLVMFCTLKNAS